MKGTEFASIREILHPRSVAILGASKDNKKWGGRLLQYMTRHRHDGKLYPINPKGGQLMGEQAYPSLAECPAEIDMAVLVLPSHHVLSAMEACARKKVRSVIILSSGFSETGEKGAALERQIMDLARASGIRVLGPNCMGVLNTQHRLAATTAITMGYVDELPVGSIGMVSQSGALMGAMLARGIDVGAGFSTMVSLGNQNDIDQNDILEYLIDDPATQVITMYIEAVKEADRFVCLLKKARQQDKPVLAVKSGRSASGGKAVMSHTASLAGAWPAFEAVCRANGVVLFDDVYDMLEGAMVLNGGARMAGPNIAVFSGSGGGGALIADSLEEAGLALPQLGDATRQKLSALIAGSEISLPIDFAAMKPGVPADPTFTSPIAAIVGNTMADANVNGGIVYLSTLPYMEEVALAAIEVAQAYKKPLIVVYGASSVGEKARQILKDGRQGFVNNQAGAIKILQALWNCARMPAPDADAADPATPQAPIAGSGFLPESESRKILEAYRIPTSPWRLAGSPDEVIAAWKDLGSVAVVVKAVSATLVHKSDVGAVRLNLKNEESLRQACLSIEQALQLAGHRLDGFLVSTMIKTDAELIVGIQRDPVFGPLVMVGAGGILVELLKDVQLCPAPINIKQAEAMLERLRCKPMLDGWRGAAPVDKRKLAMLLVQVGSLAHEQKHLEELDINPLIISDGDIYAVDARIIMAGREP
ncbi:acetate--CoA ligase family protein [Candidimonas nitroreducens]|nr:acetate--CoA ligase family protein [Candidimonas nitroreducens]